MPAIGVPLPALSALPSSVASSLPSSAADALPYAMVGAILVLALSILGSLRGRGPRALLWIALIACLAGILWLTLADVVVDSHPGSASVNLTLFQEIERALHSNSRIAWLNLVGNVAMFAPLGAALVALLRGSLVVRALAATALGAALSGAIELVQLTLGRVADIDDILLNTVGAFGGAVVAALVIGIVRAVRGPGYDGGRASSSVGRAADF